FSQPRPGFGPRPDRTFSAASRVALIFGASSRDVPFAVPERLNREAVTAGALAVGVVVGVVVAGAGALAVAVTVGAGALGVATLAAMTVRGGTRVESAGGESTSFHIGRTGGLLKHEFGASPLSLAVARDLRQHPPRAPARRDARCPGRASPSAPG